MYTRKEDFYIMEYMKDIYDFLKTFDLHTIIIVGIAFYWLHGNIQESNVELQGKIAALEGKMQGVNTGLQGSIQDIKTQIGDLRQDMAVLKTVLIMKDVMPKEIAKCKEAPSS